MADGESIQLLARWRGGDQQAAAELFQRYAERLIALARRRLSTRLATRIDPEDVVQSVYGSFFVGARDGRFTLERSGDLWRLLVSITLNKLFLQARHHTAGKRDMDQEQGRAADSAWGIPTELLAREPTPDEAVALTDTLEEVLRRLEPVERRMVELRLQGYRLIEIVAETQHSKSAVLRVLERVQRQLKQSGQTNNGV
jgi:RNA polymerase sigma factor (sigma-70 family)